MADKIVQPKVLASQNPDTYDNLIIAQAQNATNATNGILKADGTYTGFTLDSNGVLKIGDTIIPQKKLIWKNDDGIYIDTSITSKYQIPYTDASSILGKKLCLSYSINEIDDDCQNEVIFKAKSNIVKNTILYLTVVDQIQGGDSEGLFLHGYEIRMMVNTDNVEFSADNYSYDVSKPVYSPSSITNQIKIYALYEIIE